MPPSSPQSQDNAARDSSCLPSPVLSQSPPPKSTVHMSLAHATTTTTIHDLPCTNVPDKHSLLTKHRLLYAFLQSPSHYDVSANTQLPHLQQLLPHGPPAVQTTPEHLPFEGDPPPQKHLSPRSTPSCCILEPTNHPPTPPGATPTLHLRPPPPPSHPPPPPLPLPASSLSPPSPLPPLLPCSE